MPPGTGICHQVNLEYLARVVESRDGVAFPDTVVGTDSHTTMVNGLGVLGWGVGGIEAEAAMLGEPLSMLVPQVVGFRLSGRLREGTTATDLVLTVDRAAAPAPASSASSSSTSATGVVEPDGRRPRDAREHVARVRRDVRLLPGRRADARLPAPHRPPAERVALVEAYCRENLLWHEPDEHPEYSQVVELDLGDVEPSLAGPRRPQDRVPLARAKEAFLEALADLRRRATTTTRPVAETFPASDPTTEQAPAAHDGPDARGRGRRRGAAAPRHGARRRSTARSSSSATARS